jgi:hypothetical protein
MIKPRKRALGALATAMLIGGAALADDKSAAKAPAELPKEEKVVAECDNGEEPCQLLNGLLSDCFKERTRIRMYGHLEQGYTVNVDSPTDRLNFGRLFDDRSNDYRLNQLVVTMERALDTEHPECFDWGFKVQTLVGTDARFIHYLGILDNFTDDAVQPDLVEAHVLMHLPILTEGGVDIKAGHFVTLHGAEVIYALGNPLYSHSYIFNFGIPFKHTGVLAITHLTDWLDVHSGLVSGINTGFDDNNDAWSFHGGLGMKFNDDRVVMMHSLHIGPENDDFFAIVPPNVNANGDLRVIYDGVITVKIGCKLTSITDVNFGRDYGFDAYWYGTAQYFIYQLNDRISPILRIESWRDEDGFAAAKFGENDDFIDLQRGEVTAIDPVTGNAGAATYTALTVGVNIKATDCLLLRPEVRWDWASGAAAFNDFSDSQQMTIGMDAILKF